jgi:manganese transport protein
VIAIIPALLTIIYFGEEATGKLLIFSQVILSLQLGFAVIPLIHFVSDKSTMKDFTIPRYVQVLAWLSATIIVVLNANLVYDEISSWLEASENPLLLWLTVVPIAIAALLLLLYITFRPFFHRKPSTQGQLPHPSLQAIEEFETITYQKIAVAVDFSYMDTLNIANAIRQGGKDCQYLLIHIVESAGAHMMQSEIRDYEERSDQRSLEKYGSELNQKGYKTEVKLGYGNPKRAIPKLVNEYGADLLVMGAHGHKGFKDLILGTTVDAVRHRVKIPVLIVQR